MYEMGRGQTMTTLFTDIQEFTTWRNEIPKHDTVGFVPTMGALHGGHISLMQRARSECDHVVVSIYVNALQFNSLNDFSKYPRTESVDFELCAQVGVDSVLVPLQSDMFISDSPNLLSPSKEAEAFEGTDRPGHFSGVITVVDRLFAVVQPTAAYFGLKDYQQVAVIRNMATTLHPRIDIRPCDTMRETDGLAMSSRNRFLTETARASAGLIPLALSTAIAHWRNGCRDASEVTAIARSIFDRDASIELQYLSIVKDGTMDQVEAVSERDSIIAAVVIDGIRLIDNMQFSNA